MSLQQQLPEGGKRIRWVDGDCIRIDDQELRSHFALSPEQIWAADSRSGSPLHWQHADWRALLAALKPQILLFGSGDRQRFLSPAILGFLMQQGVGVECMDNHAAARTFNLLADEDRPVVAVFCLGTNQPSTGS